MPQCRACDVDHHRVLPLFSTTGGNLVDLSTMFANVTEVKIIKNDGAPNHLCMVCCKKLQEAYDFKIKCLMIDKKRKESNMRISMEPNSLTDAKNPVYLCLKTDNSLVPETLDMLQTDQMYADELLVSNIKGDSDTDHIEPELICVDTKLDVKKEYLPDDISHDFSDDDDLPLATRRSKRRKKITNVDVIQDILDSEGPVSRHKEYACIICKNVFKNSSSFKVHIISQHSSEQDILDSEGPVSRHKEYACIICKNVFKNSSSFKVHIISQHSSQQKSEPHTLPTEILKVTHSKNGKKMLKCVICQAGFTCNETLKSHLKSHFPDEYPEESVKRKPVKIAPVVKKVAVAKITKKKVKDKHVPVETPVNCDYCHAKLQDAEDWKEHEARHLAEHKPFRCIYEGCPGVYKTRCALRNHFNTHTQSKSFQCRYCPKRFNQRSNAMSHERTHTGIKPYLCSECGRSFRESGNLNQHMRQHTGEKPYSCHLCPKVFTTLYSRKVHVRTHLKIKPYLCSECGKSFVASGKLLIHKRIHSGYRPYVCKLCEAAFHDSNGLKRHMKIH